MPTTIAITRSMHVSPYVGRSGTTIRLRAKPPQSSSPMNMT